MASFLSPLLKGEARDYRLVNERTGVVVAEHLLTAFDSVSRKTGLLQHTSLPESTALIIAPSNAIHTFFMKFAIDVAFVARDGRVVKVRPAMGAWRISAAFGAYAVIEAAAGAFATFNLAPNDRLEISAHPPQA